MNNCIFCRIAAGQCGTEFLYEDEHVVAFRDLHPQAPVHILAIPRRHYTSLKELDEEWLAGRLFTALKKVAEKLGITDFRTVVNTGAQSGQSVFHLHMHMLAGRFMSWPPG